MENLAGCRGEKGVVGLYRISFFSMSRNSNSVSEYQFQRLRFFLSPSFIDIVLSISTQYDRKGI